MYSQGRFQSISRKADATNSSTVNLKAESEAINTVKLKTLQVIIKLANVQIFPSVD